MLVKPSYSQPISAVHFFGSKTRVCFIDALSIVTQIWWHYTDVVMTTMASQITSLTVVHSINRLFRRRSKKTSKLRVTGLCIGNSPGLVNSPHKGPVTRKMFPFDDVIMGKSVWLLSHIWPFCHYNCFYMSQQHCCHVVYKMLSFNSSDAGGRIFWLWVSIPCLLMHWLLKWPKHQQAWY